MTADGRLVVVVPVHNEVAAIEETLTRLRHALERSPWREAQVVVVDDGSTDGTGDLLDVLAEPLGLTVLHGPNRGRLLARVSGLEAAGAELALLLDARVHLDEDALAHVAEEMAADPTARVWNGDVTVETAGNPFAGFWSALTVLGWRRYFADRRRTSFGLEDFDLYPKGTSLFLAPRHWLLEESATLSSHYDDLGLVSDDTAVIRGIAARARVNLSPGFSCRYHGRDGLMPFVRHSHGRGVRFVDSYVGRQGHVGRAVSGGLLAAPVAVVAAVRNPRSAMALASGLVVALGVASRRSGARPAEAVALSALSPLFAVTFGSGLLRGLVLAALTRARRVRA